MRLLKLSLKNMTMNLWRSMTLSSFILVISLLLVICNALIETVKTNMQTSIRQALSGEIQIREGTTTETDLFSMGGGWRDVTYMKASETKKLEEILDYQVKPPQYTFCIRNGCKIASDTETTSGMVMGIDLGTNVYQNSLLLKEGRYAYRPYELVISSEQADQLEVGVGDWISLMISDRQDELKSEAFKVVGIGNIQILSNFGFDTIYIDIHKMGALCGFSQGEATDVFIYCPVNKVRDYQEKLMESLRRDGVDAACFKVSTWREMGGFVNAIMMMLVGSLYVFLGVFIVIVGVLILNIVTIMVAERRKEIGSFRAIGYSRGQVLVIFLGELLGLAVMASIIGCFLGQRVNAVLSHRVVHMTPPMDYLLGSTYALQYDPTQGIPVFILMIGFTIICSIGPCLRAVSERPVEILRG